MWTEPMIPLYIYLLTIALMIVLQWMWHLLFLKLVKKHYRKMLARREREVEEVSVPLEEKENLLPQVPEPEKEEPKRYYFPMEEVPEKKISKDDRLLEKVVDCIEKHMQRSDFSVEELSSGLGMSRVHLYKRMLALTGKTPLELIRSARMKRAACLLAEDECSIAEVALKVGINNPKNFTKYFKEEYGVLPSVYQGKKKG